MLGQKALVLPHFIRTIQAKHALMGILQKKLTHTDLANKLIIRSRQTHVCDLCDVSPLCCTEGAHCKTLLFSIAVYPMLQSVQRPLVICCHIVRPQNVYHDSKNNKKSGL